jgi:hypothetical protein
MAALERECEGQHSPAVCVEGLFAKKADGGVQEHLRDSIQSRGIKFRGWG